MASIKVFKAPKSKTDVYQSAQSTQYRRDQTTGDLLLTSGTNNRTIITEQFKTARFVADEDFASNATNTIYTVPQGKVFLLCGVTLQISFNAGTYGNSGTLKIDGTAVLRGFGSANAGAYSTTQNLNQIIVLSAGQYIDVETTNVNIKACGNIFGYEIDRSEYYPANS